YALDFADDSFDAVIIANALHVIPEPLRMLKEAGRLLSAYIPGIKSLRDVDVETFNNLACNLPERVGKRARHIVDEIQRTIEAI
ncbi:methyltransferase domain-containing protein, partial [Citrobacter sp. AAK_AS5]